MDIVSRIKLFLNANGITNSQFADTCGIPRPTLSQLLTGRNKKISDEIFTKIHTAYPTLNMMWLMFGDGDMLTIATDSAQTSGTNFASYESHSANPDTPSPSTTPSNSQQSAILFDDISTTDQTDPKIGQNVVSPEQALSQALRHLPLQSIKKSQPSPSTVKGGKQVVSIMVFYSDNSFETFLPAQNP